MPTVDSQPDWDGTWSRTNYSHGESDSSPYIALSADGKTLVTSDGYYNAQSGRVRIHQEVDGNWTYRTQFSGSSYTYFGEHAITVNGDGSVIAVGAYPENLQQGYVDIYRQSSETSWTRTRNNLAASNGTRGDHFSYTVSLNRAGDRLAVGAKYEDGESITINDQGAVYIFDYDGSSWNETQILRASDAAAGDYFGEWVVLTGSGDQLAVSTQDAEAVYTYDLSNADSTTWQSTENSFASPSSRNDGFGTWGLAFNGNDVVVGAYHDDTGYQGIVTNSDANSTFDENDATSTGNVFDNTDTSIVNSGGAYVIANEPYALTSLDGLQARVDASNAILAWAAGGSIAPTVQQYKDAVIENVSASNLADMNSQIQSLEHTDMANVQTMVDAINAILAFTSDSSQTAPTNNDYLLAGITDVNVDNLTLLNDDVGDGSLSMAEIQSLASQLNHLVLIRNYSLDSTNAVPTLDNYTGANLGVPRAVNVPAYNAKIVNANFTTRTELAGVVSAINHIDDYANGITLAVPTISTYQNANFIDIHPMNIELVNQQIVNSGSFEFQDVQVISDALQRLTQFASDTNLTAPTLDDYQVVGLNNAGENILDYVNLHLPHQLNRHYSQFIKASNANAGNQFGYKTALSADGNTMAVLAKFASAQMANSTNTRGSVYIYRRVGNDWQEVNVLRSEQDTNGSEDISMTATGDRVVLSGANQAFVFDVPELGGNIEWDGVWERTVINHGIASLAVRNELSATGSTLLIVNSNDNTNTGRASYMKRLMAFGLVKKLMLVLALIRILVLMLGFQVMVM
ncbi:glycoprotein gp2 [Vibrio ponticus]|nr:glycoprotein gp2 [Vibrio ponticus]